MKKNSTIKVGDKTLKLEWQLIDEKPINVYKFSDGKVLLGIAKQSNGNYWGVCIGKSKEALKVGKIPKTTVLKTYDEIILAFPTKKQAQNVLQAMLVIKEVKP